MKPNRPSKKLLLRKFRKYLKIFAEILDRYIANPDEESIHDIRVAIRRLQAIQRILPKKVRRRRKMLEFYGKAKELFSINTQIRDFDIICAKLAEKKQAQFDQIIDSLKIRRKKQLNAAHNMAAEARNLPFPRLKQSELTDPQLRKRYRKVVLLLANEIKKNIPIVIGSDKKIEEIHRLRKDFKKLRYSVELTVEEADSLQSVKKLKKIQDELGMIHDSDIFLEHLRGMGSALELSDVIRDEVLERTKRYRQFVKVFRQEKLEPMKLIL